MVVSSPGLVKVPVRQVVAEPQPLKLCRTAHDHGPHVLFSRPARLRFFLRAECLGLNLEDLTHIPVGPHHLNQKLTGIAIRGVQVLPTDQIPVTGEDPLGLLTQVVINSDVLPGIPWGSLEGGALPGLPVVSKAGSFGGDDALLTAIRFLDDRSRPPATSSPTP